jgi:predicted GH43/DUF377 family glycosyl hydrolase
VKSPRPPMNPIKKHVPLAYNNPAPRQLPPSPYRAAPRTIQQVKPSSVKTAHSGVVLRSKEAVKPRLLHDRLTTVPGRIIRLPFPSGSFNAGLVELPGTDRFICVYRPDEMSFTACFLDSNLNLIPGTQFSLGINNCADPRLVWINDKLLMIYSSIDLGTKIEAIGGGVIMDLVKSTDFIRPTVFRVSPPGDVRQKNWMPFITDGRIYLIASVKPHIIYELSMADLSCRKVYETPWLSPWFSTEFMRGNTNPVQLADGNWLGTFHTVQRVGDMYYYDNGCYVFEGVAPFRVLRCSNRSYFKAEDAVEPHYRKAGLITVNFPVGMVRLENRLLISYGDNDSAVKILDTTVSEMLATTLAVY